MAVASTRIGDTSVLRRQESLQRAALLKGQGDDPSTVANLAEHRDRGLVVPINDAEQHLNWPVEYTATLFPRLKSLRVETVAARMDLIRARIPPRSVLDDGAPDGDGNTAHQHTGGRAHGKHGQGEQQHETEGVHGCTVARPTNA